MNHRIREKRPSGPVIVVQEHLTSDGPSQRESNEFEIRFRGQPIGRVKFDPKGLAAVETHDVTAWVELDDDVQVIDTTPCASLKKPNNKVGA